MNWVDAVTSHIVSQLTTSVGLVEDNDALLQINELQSLIEKGIHVLRVSSTLALRYEYDYQIREIISKSFSEHDISTKHSQNTVLFIIEFSPKLVPFDIKLNSKHLKISIKTFFPNLNYKILRKIPVSWRQDLFQIPQPPKVLSEKDTIHFIIEQCLGLDSNDLINSTSDAFMFLSDMALRGVEFPIALAPYLVSSNSTNYRMLVRVVEKLSTSRQYLTFFENLWNSFVQSQTTKIIQRKAAESSENTELNLFIDVLETDKRCQNQMTRLLLDNVINPARLSSDGQPPKWMRKNIHYYVDEKSAIKSQLASIENSKPNKTSRVEDWTEFIHTWAKFNTLLSKHSELTSDFHTQVIITQTKIDQNFLEWLSIRYTSLLQRPYLPKPTMVHHVLPYLNARFNSLVDSSLAVVVLDGMAYDDWLIVHQSWNESGIPWSIEVDPILALVPTITSVSRQALLSGQIPRHFSQYWLSTQNESNLWKSFWITQGVNSRGIHYLKGLGVTSSAKGLEPSVQTLLKQPHMKAAAFIVNTIDNLIHNNWLGKTAIHQNIQLWINQTNYLRNLVSSLLDIFSVVIITSDHGHIEGQGVGDIDFSSLADERAYRTRIFSKSEFGDIEIDHERFYSWPAHGLPDGSVIFLPKGHGFFANPSIVGTSHGGISVDEVFIPLITITRR